MKFFFFLTFLISVAKGGISVGIGILLRKHFDTILSLIIRKPIPEGLIDKNKHESVLKIMEWIGLFVIIIGVLTVFFAFATLFTGNSMTNGNFNFKF